MAEAPAKSFQDLIVWQKSHLAVLEIYKRSAHFPRAEMDGLTSQLRRAAVSIPANITEGFARRGRPEKARFMNIAQSSLEETRYYLMLAKDLGYLEDQKLFVDFGRGRPACWAPMREAFFLLTPNS